MPVFYGLTQAPVLANPANTAEAVGTASRHQLPTVSWPLPYPGWEPLDHRSATQWTLTLEGDVTQPITLKYAELLALPQSHQMRRLVSRQGWMMKAEWQGVLLKYVMNKVILKPGVRFIQQKNAQGQQVTLPLEALIKQDALLTLREGLQPISAWQGGPIRLQVYEQYAEFGLHQLTTLRFLTQWPTDEVKPEKEGLVQPGKYYAYDLKALKTLDRAGEAKAI